MVSLTLDWASPQFSTLLHLPQEMKFKEDKGLETEILSSTQSPFPVHKPSIQRFIYHASQMGADPLDLTEHREQQPTIDSENVDVLSACLIIEDNSIL